MTTIFHNAQIDKEKLRDIILKNPQTLLSGLSFIDLQMSTEDDGIIDFLGVDPHGRLVIVNFDINANDNMLINVLSQIQWLKKNQGLIKRLFFSESISFENPFQIVLVGPAFSNKLQAAVKQLSGKDIKLLNYKYIVSKSDDAIMFDEVFSNLKSNAIQTSKPEIDGKQSDKIEYAVLNKKEVIVEKSDSISKIETIEEEQSPLYDVITLTPEEIAEFMDFDIVLEQNQTAD